MAQEIPFGRPNTGIDRSTLLASNELFRHLRSDQLAGLARYTRLQNFSHHQPIFRPDDSGVWEKFWSRGCRAPAGGIINRNDPRTRP